MKKISLFFFSILLATTGFAESFVLDNQTSYPDTNLKSKIAVQWANSAKEVDENNKAMIHGEPLTPNSIQNISKSGKTTLTIPDKAEYFRILAWSKNTEEPDLLTNWIDIVPNKTYTLETDHLVPAVLMSGTGC
ncbi:MAG: hypothetical protein K2Y01_08565 [Rhabdochlamydiaceae bacterium]|nr:hypothetical protein [Rhabdochlamydiaceae bacterium]